MINIRELEGRINRYSSEKYDLEFKINEIREEYKKLFKEKTKELNKRVGEISFISDKEVNDIFSGKCLIITVEGGHRIYTRVNSAKVDDSEVAPGISLFGTSIKIYSGCIVTSYNDEDGYYFEDIRTDIPFYKILDIEEVTKDEIKQQLPSDLFNLLKL